MRDYIRRNWRGFLARLPLLMLAIPASYGVYEFSELFLPTWVAIIQAAAFETVYIGMASYDKLTKLDRRHALIISLFAVFVSAADNTLAGIFSLSPKILSEWRVQFEWIVILSALHGTPLTLLGFFVSNFTLHKGEPASDNHAQNPVDRIIIEQPSLPAPIITEEPPTEPEMIDERDRAIVAMMIERKKQQQIADALGITRQAVNTRIKRMKQVAPQWLKQQLSKMDEIPVN